MITRCNDTVCLLSAGAQYRCASATTRNIEGEILTLQITVPDTSAVTRCLALSIAMLSLQISSRHERVRLDRLRRKLASFLQIVFVDDLKRECVEDYLLEIFVDA